MPNYADLIINIVLEELKHINPYDVSNGLRGKCRDRISAEIDTWFNEEE